MKRHPGNIGVSLFCGDYMLIDKDKKPQFAKGDVIGFRLSSGEEVVGRVESTDTATGAITLKKPVITGLVPQHDSTGRPTGRVDVNFLPYMLSLGDDGIVVFSRENMITPVSVRKELAARYLSATTGIEVPTNDRSNLIRP
jgi:hypothetical protein